MSTTPSDPSSTFNRCRAEVAALLAEHAPMGVVEQRIDASGLDEDTKAVLSLWAARTA